MFPLPTSFSYFFFDFAHFYLLTNKVIHRGYPLLKDDWLKVDEDTGMVLDHETWFMDLEEANHNIYSQPVWRKLYSVKEAYQFTSLDPWAWDDFVRRMDEDADLFSHFYFNYHAGSALRPECDPICKRQIFCNLRTSLSHSKEETCDKDKKGWSYLDIFNWFY